MAAVSRVVHTTCDKNTLAHGLVVIETGPHKCALALNMAIEHRDEETVDVFRISDAPLCHYCCE